MIATPAAKPAARSAKLPAACVKALEARHVLRYILSPYARYIGGFDEQTWRPLGLWRFLPGRVRPGRVRLSVEHGRKAVAPPRRHVRIGRYEVRHPSPAEGKAAPRIRNHQVARREDVGLVYPIG